MAPKKKGSDVLGSARGRLKGALQDVVTVPENDPESIVPNRGRPPKRAKTSPPTPLQNTFIMKLFDRSVDLAKYNENTALYPICRAWMLNMPRSNKIPNFNNKSPYVPVKRKFMPTFIDDLKSGKIHEITEFPQSNENVTIQRLPSLLSFQQDASKDKIDLEYDIDNAPVTREILLGDLKHRGLQVRKQWQKHTKMYNEAKYSQTFDALKVICKQ